MNINVDKNSILKLALGKVSQGEFFEALKLFSQVDSYESDLNRVGCLAMLGDKPYAWDAYRKVRIKYGSTHNCHADQLLTGDALDEIVDYTDHDLPVEQKARADDRISADADWLGFFTKAGNPDFQEAGLDLDFYQDALDWDDPNFSENNFYDINSQEYRTSLRLALEKAYLDEKKGKFKQLSKRFLSLDAPDFETVEAQIILSVYRKEFKNGVKFARKYVEFQDGFTTAGVGAAIDAVLGAGVTSHNKDLLKKLLEIAENDRGEYCVYDLVNYSRLALTEFEDTEKSYVFATELYKKLSFCGIDALKICLCAFYNYGKVEEARQVAVDILNAVPDDVFANGFFMFLNTDFGDKPPMLLDMADKADRFFWVPLAFFYASRISLSQHVKDGRLILDTECYLPLQTIVNFYKKSVICGDIEAFARSAELTHKLIYSAIPTNNDEFFVFAKKVMFSLLNDPVILESIITKAVRLGMREDVYLCLCEDVRMLDLSCLTETDDRFLRTLALVATIGQADVAELQKNFAALKAAVEIGDDSDTTRCVAYALLAMSSKKRDPAIEDAFGEFDKKLYKEYRNYCKQQKKATNK